MIVVGRVTLTSQKLAPFYHLAGFHNVIDERKCPVVFARQRKPHCEKFDAFEAENIIYA